jgi:hypothetical protein
MLLPLVQEGALLTDNYFKQFHILVVLMFIAGSGHAYDGPIIDMHFHAWPSAEDGPPDTAKNLAAMESALERLRAANVVLAATSGPEEYLEQWSAAEPERLLLGPVFPCIEGKNPNWHQYRCFRNSADFPDLDSLEARYVDGTYGVMGELYNQYAGIPYDDPRMAPYYELAERLGIPVAFHTHSAPPLTAHRCCPAFRISAGSPMLLENVLARYPKLKVQIMHANPLTYPAILDLLVQYPKVYVDVSPWEWVLPREKFHRLLHVYKEAGLLGRVMYGSDGADYEKALEAYGSAEFLSEQELAGIFCKNAARFLRKQDLCTR